MRFIALSNHFHAQLTKIGYSAKVPVVAAGYWKNEKYRKLWYVSSVDDNKTKEDPLTDYLPELWTIAMKSTRGPGQSHLIKSSAKGRITASKQKIDTLTEALDEREEIVNKIAARMKLKPDMRSHPSGIPMSLASSDDTSHRVPLSVNDSQMDGVIDDVVKKNTVLRKILL